MRLLDDSVSLNGNHAEAMHWSIWRSRGVGVKFHEGIYMLFLLCWYYMQYSMFETPLQTVVAGVPFVMQDQTKTNLFLLLLS